jgi:hypothetical protein
MEKPCIAGQLIQPEGEVVVLIDDAGLFLCGALCDKQRARQRIGRVRFAELRKQRRRAAATLASDAVAIDGQVRRRRGDR